MELVLSLLFDEEQKELTSWHTWHVLRMIEYIQAPESGTAHYIRGDLRRCNDGWSGQTQHVLKPASKPKEDRLARPKPPVLL